MDIREILALRSNSYGFLARLFRIEVDQKLLDEISALNITSEEAQVVSGWRMLKGYVTEQHEGVLLDLARDYARTFCGANLPKNSAAYLFESVYASPKGLLMQDSRDEVLKLYDEEQLLCKEDFMEPEDHLAAELEFMAHLCERTIQKLDEGKATEALEYLSKQQSFLKKHLLPWVPHFSEIVQKIAQQDFYKGAAKVVSGYLQEDLETIREVDEQLRASLATGLVEVSGD